MLDEAKNRTMSEEPIRQETENPPPQVDTPDRLTHIALGVAIAALLVTGWQWFAQRQQVHHMEQALTHKLGEADARNRETLALARRADETALQSATKITRLEQLLEESRAQQEALQILYVELANSRDERIMAEVEQILAIASQQLQLAGNVKAALLALQTVDSRLKQIDKPQVIQLRKVIARDLQKLQALPSVDIVGMSLKLESLVDAADKIPLASERHPRTSSNLAPDWDSSPWHRLAQEIWQDIKALVRIERMDRPEAPLLPPEQAYFLRENYKLRLLAARIALLQHDEATYRNDLHTAELWLKRYFDIRDAAAQNALNTLKQLSADDISIELPDISESLNAVTKFKLSLERGKP